MAQTQMAGYNVRLKIGTKDIVGVTSDEMTITANVKESITKDNNGVKQKAVTGHDWSFKVSALMILDDAATPTALDRDAVLDLVVATGSGAVLAATYGASTGDTYAGNVVITGYSESTSADPETDASFTLDLQSAGAWAKQV